MIMIGAMPASRNPSGLGLWIVDSPSEKKGSRMPLDPHLISSHLYAFGLTVNSLHGVGGTRIYWLGDGGARR